MCEFKAQNGMCMTQHDVRIMVREIALQGKTAQNIPKKIPILLNVNQPDM